MTAQPTVLLIHCGLTELDDLTQALVTAGMRVVLADAADDYLRLTIQIAPAITIVAEDIPGAGPAICRALRNDLRTTAIPRLLLAAAPPDTNLNSLVDMWLAPPFSAPQLLALVRLLMRVYAAEHQPEQLPYEQIVQTALEGFWIIRVSDLRFLAVNETYCAMSGYSRSELLKLHVSDIEAVESLQEVEERRDRIMTQGFDRFEAHHRRKDGTIFDVEISVRYINVAATEAIMVVFIRDITDRKRAEAAREHMQEELTRKNRELEQIVYVASHDLRSPLVNVQGFSRELRASLDDLKQALANAALTPAQRDAIGFLIEQDIPESLDFILTGVSKMDALLQGLLRLSRLGRAALTLEPLDVNQIVAETLAAFDFQIKQAGAQVSVGTLPNCRGDAVQIGQIFANLISNALKYLAPGRPGEIKISGRSDEGMAIYCVADNGQGIAADQQDKIFEMYYRVNPTQSEGDGLGLTIVRTIADRHGGWVKLTSEPRGGSQFFVALPEAI